MPNHITNGIFETNTATTAAQTASGWTNTSGTTDLQTDGGFEWAGTYNQADLNASSGSGYITMYATPSYSESMQTTLNTPIVAGETYTFNFDFYVNNSDGTTNNPAASVLEVTIGTQVLSIPIDSTGASAPYWQTESFTFTATSSSSTLSIASTFDTDTLLYTGLALDNLVLDLTPNFIVEGSAGADTIDAAYLGDPNGDDIDNLDHSDGSNADSIEAGAGDDIVDAGLGDDTIDGGTGADTLSGASGDDTFILSDDFGADSISGGETGETSGDTLDLSAVTDDLTLDLTASNPEAGSVSDGIDTASFVEIENITLGSGADTLVLADGGGNDTVSGFDLSDSGDGTAIDQLDVSGLTSDGGTTPVDVDDVIVSDTNGDGTGDAILTFPGGESITLIGVPPSAVDSPAELEAIGIPAAATPLNYIVEGDGTDNLIDATYLGDPDGDRVDNSDALDGTQDDSIQGGAGNDTILAGAGNDSVDAGDDDDRIEGGTGSDTLYGGIGEDTLLGGIGDDSLYGNEDNDSIEGGAGNDTVEAGTGDDTIIGGAGNDSINGDIGNDSIFGGAGDDFLRGSFGNDTITGGTGADTLWGGFGDDVFNVAADFGSYIIEGEEEEETIGDTMDLSNITNDLTIDLSNANPEAGTFTDGTNTGTFVDIETIILGSGNDTLVLDTFGGSDTVSGFSVPTDTGGGTFSGNDQLDVTGLLDFDGNATHTGNVIVTDSVGDGTGDAILTFPNGESLTLIGVLASDVSSPAQLIAMGIPDGPDGYVDGTAGDDTIDAAYLGDPNFDRVDNNDAELPGAAGDDDFIRAGAGNDSVIAGAGDDSVEGGSGGDTIDGGAGADTLSGDAGEDSLVGGLGDDSLIGGAGDDILNGQIGDDVLSGGDGSDTFALEDDFGSDTIIGGEIDDAAGDVLDMSSVGGALTYDLTRLDAESGTVTDGTGVIEFEEIETIQLSSSTDILTLDNGSGDDSVTGFTAPTLAGDGSWIGFDQLDVSTMTDANGAMVNTADVEISDTNGDGTGDTILTFPGGETLTLIGVLPIAFPVPEALAAIGIPLADYIVEGTSAGELIDGSYMGDPEGDIVDAGDAENGTDDDIIEAGPGDDTVVAGAGDDSIFGDEGADDIDAGAGADTVFGGDDADTIFGGADDDSLLGQAGDDSISGDAGDDFIEGGAGVDTLLGGIGADTLDGGADDDSLDGGAGDDSLLGNFGDDTLQGGAGNDTLQGGFGDDTFVLSNGFGDDDIDGEADLETIGDTLDASGVTAEGVSIVFSGDETGTLTGAVSADEAAFTEIENITATDNADTINAALDTVGVNVDAGDGDDIVTGGSGIDTLFGGDGNDTISGGITGDLITAGDGDDTINVGQGDTVTGGDGDDFFNIVDLGEIDTDVITITGGEGDETDGDTLALNGLHDRDSLTITDPDDVNGGLSGTVTLLDGTIVNFTNIENIICFVAGTEIATPYGARDIDTLKIGDSVVTQDNGVQRICWIGKSTVPATDHFAPIRFAQKTFPAASADLVVSPQHRMLFKGYEAELLFGASEVLIPAVHLIDGLNVRREEIEAVTYIHIMFEQHEIIFAQGVATESFHPGACGVDCLAPRAREELFALFPEIRSDLANFGPSARTSLKAQEAKVLMRF